MSKLRKLTLGGFQTIKNVVEIEFSPLTLLVGPNSSGKSAILDALKLAKELFELSKDRGQKNFLSYTGLYWLDEKVEDRPFFSIIKNWRRTGPLDRVESLQDRMTLGVQLDMKKNLLYQISPDNFPSFDLKQFEEEETLEIGLLCSFWWVHNKDGDRYLNSDLYRDFELTIQKELLAFYRSGVFRINLAHPLFSYNRDYNELLSFNLNDDENYRISLDNHWLEIRSSGYIVLNDCLKLWHGITDEPHGPAKDYSVGKLQSLYNTIIEIIMSEADFLPGLVDASRRVPTQADLSYNIRDRFSSDYFESIVESYGFTRSGDDQFERLAVSCAESLPDYEEDQRDGGAVLETVNRYLSDYLFIDRGYQLGFEYAVVMKSSDYREAAGTFEKFYLSNYELLVKIHLFDSYQVRLDFSDVGSGLGYVLPVLIAVAEHDGSLLVQQPELHLHPAMQSSMADVLVDSLTSNGVLMIETHSEHLILRILKRIRQSNTGLCYDNNLAISAEKVTVLYFDSLPDSSTSIKRIRISKNGEFLDRWPHGFFEERDRELFDE